jgi:hypothetical protein
MTLGNAAAARVRLIVFSKSDCGRPSHAKEPLVGTSDPCALFVVHGGAHENEGRPWFFRVF